MSVHELDLAHLPNIAAALCCDCGHDNDRHGPEAGGCIECTCELTDPAERKALSLDVSLKVLGKFGDGDDTRALLDMLGIVVDGQLQPDPPPLTSLPSAAPKAGKSAREENPADLRARPKVSTAPDALRNLPPATAPAAAAPAHRATDPGSVYSPRKTQVGSAAQIAAAQATARGRFAPCGQYGAYRRHLRHGEPIDAACAEAARKQWRDRDRARVRGNRNAA